jgi:hypothetical protein
METLQENKSKVKSNHTIIEVLEFCRSQDLPARVVGRWVWVKFESKPDAETRQSLKDMGFRWSKRRSQWSHNCGRPTKPAHNYKPWDKYQTISLDEAYAGLEVA